MINARHKMHNYKTIFQRLLLKCNMKSAILFCLLVSEEMFVKVNVDVQTYRQTRLTMDEDQLQ